MWSRLQDWKVRFIALLSILLLFHFACNRTEKYTGTYLAKDEKTAEHLETVIKLKEDGVGVWRARDDETDFRWDVKNDEIRLHTKAGGVIIGRIRDASTLEIKLPGRKNRYFKKTNN